MTKRIKLQPVTVGLRNVGFFGWKVSPPILLLSKEKCVAPKPTLLKPTAVMPHLLNPDFKKVPQEKYLFFYRF
jgi:hypothetical protein